MTLNLDTSCIQNSPTLFSKPTPCFLLPIMIKCNKSMIMWTQTLFDLGASTCFINKELVWQHNLALVEKMTPLVVEVIDGHNLSSKLITHETKTLIIIIGSHSSKVVFNVISSPTNPIIIGLSWLILHNHQMDWKMKCLHFESINETTPKYETFPTSTLDSEHDYAHENTRRTSQHI